MSSWSIKALCWASTSEQLKADLSDPTVPAEAKCHITDELLRREEQKHQLLKQLRPS